MRRVVVEWLDAHGDGGGWMDIDEINPEIKPCETMGFVVADSDEFICVVQTHGFDGQYYNHMCVPRGMITKIEEV